MDLSDWIWILPLVYFLLSAIGSVAQKKAKELAEQQRGRRTETTLAPLDEPQPPSRGPAPAPARSEPVVGPVRQVRPMGPMRPQPRSAEDIAAEIRRMMGLEPARPEPVEVVIQPEPTVGDDHGGNLHDHLAARQASGRHSSGTLEARMAGRASAGKEQRQLGSTQLGATQLGSLGGPRRVLPAAGRREYKGSAYLDLSNIARALVTAEVLGPPKGLRDDW
jgi:hypothetical protein